MEKKQIRTKILIALILIIFFALLAVILLSGGNLQLLRKLFLEKHTNDEIRDILSDLGIRGHITVGVLSMLQVTFPFLPAEPVQVIAGVSFGFLVGVICCVAGVFVGNTIIFVLHKAFGEKIRNFFVRNLNFDIEKAATSPKVTIVIFILYFLPAIPYGMICFFAASVGMKYPRYIIATVLGAIPSVCIGVGLGHIAIASSWIISILVFSLIVSILLVLMKKKELIFSKINNFVNKSGYSTSTTVKKYKARSLFLPYIISKTILFLRGVRVKYTNKLENEIEGPAIVLCNHGSFLDFVYAGTILRKKAPNFIVARLYFYKKWFGNLLRRFGCFPKSMFTVDLESAKNCLRVLKNGSVLAMMPEARLSTVGKFEDIQEGTFDFVKKSKVPIYTVTMRGDYFASPKWGNGIRRGALVEAELDILFTPTELSELSVEQIKEKIEARLYYDEFEWIKTRPEVSYRSKSLAQGLENILSLCPKCNGKFTITTKKHDVYCEKCGKLATLDNRYSFDVGAPFENFSKWYDWQKEELKKEILSNPDFAISSKVELHLPSLNGKTTLRQAGNGVCTLDKTGLTYSGTKDGDDVSLHFPIEQIYRLLFGAGENFEVYLGKEIHYFVPEEKRSCVQWYMASSIIYDEAKSPLVQTLDFTI